MDRRKFIESAGRWGIIGILAAIAGILIRRKSVSLSSDCDPKFCDSCNKQSTCNTALNPGSNGTGKTKEGVQ